MAVTEVIDFGLVKIEKDIGNLATEFDVIAKEVQADDEVMHEIADYLVARVREHFDTRAFIPVKPETINRRRWPFHPSNGIGSRAASSSTAPMVASCGTRDRIVPRSRQGYAAAKRGNKDWYLFLHEKGRGRVDFRPTMLLDPDEMLRVESMYDDWLGTVIEKDES